MKNDDVQLIHRILDGDDTAFTELVEKYQKSVHALAWRKIGDFHIAEEITQDTFLKAYQNLSTLKRPQRFASWLYVIASRRCLAWQRKKRILTKPLEETSSAQIEKETYSQYVVNENSRITAETQRDVVKKLLAKLPESERTIITLHYFSEMSSSEIGAFLGISANTIRSRLRRAQQRLQKEETMIREALDHFQISPNLTDNIMQEINRLKPAAPSASKPLVPWVIAASSAILIVLMLGIGSRYLALFQKPYSLDAQAETTVELVDTHVVLNVDTKPDVRREFGNSNVLGKSNNRGEKPDEVLLAAAQTEGEDIVAPKQQWIQENGPVGSGYLMTLFSTQEGEIYVFNSGGRSNSILYRLPVDRTEWQPVCDIVSLLQTDIPSDIVSMAKSNDILYIVVTHDGRHNPNELYGSRDGGKTLSSVGKCPDGWVVGFEVMDDRFYLAFENQIFVSKDTGKTWSVLDEGLLIGEVNTLEVIQNTLFAATNTGLYYLDGDSWQRMQFPIPVPIPQVKTIVSLAGTENYLYALTAWDWQNVGPQERTWGLFRSTNKGQSWTDITPKNASLIMGAEPFEDEPQATLAAMNNTLLIIGWRGAAVVRSIDNGNTWTLEKTTNISLMSYSVHNAVALNENTFYLQGHSGIYRSIDGGISWTRFNPEMTEKIIDLICVKTSKEQNTSGYLYAMFSGGRMEDKWVFKSSDKGKSWRVVNPEIQIQEHIPAFTRIAESDGVLYAKGRGPTSWALMSLYRISEDRNTLVPIKGMPVFSSSSLSNLLHRGPAKGSDKSYFEQLQESSVGANQFFKQLDQMSYIAENFRRLYQDHLYRFGLRGPFAVSGNTFYFEYNFKLFRWEPGDTEWYDTGQEETVRLTWKIIERELKLAVSGDTVYVGKRDGHLVVSFDRGTNWIDLTPALPFPFKTFKEIVFAGSTVYVATDAGILTSDDGRHWRTVTDAEGTNLIMEHLAVDENTLYGVTKDTGIYRLESGTWEQVVSEIPDSVTSLAVDGDTLYVGTEDNGMLHFNLEK